MRLSGALPGRRKPQSRKSGERESIRNTARRFWTGIREQTDPWFAGTLAAVAALGEVHHASPAGSGRNAHRVGRRTALAADRTLIRATVRDAARAAGGHATLFRGGDRSPGAFHPLPEGLMAIHRRLKRAFDPAGILNPGRLYADL